ncbi:hypothetical protein [Bacillus sp. Au-Bac7]|uniref:hypothetical protein n=1 Tax=Bacillus sp. Au-Bac7 TaxID=2906458 RepID=UPI001E4FA81D|nr:hypothetical protein [Bacillus sp. Au-Bac7]MCE4049910.1 hypothetical protein [Bacillus sp. Au-Bac7]
MITRQISNYLKAIRVLNEKYARKDHCDGTNALYRLVASLSLDKTFSAKDFESYLLYLTKEFEKLDVRPNAICVLETKIDVIWYPRDFQMVMNRGQYAGLCLEFAEFLNKSHLNLEIQEDSFSEDPEDRVKSVSNDIINFFPEFNARCFGSNEPIAILNLNDKYGWGKTWL